MAPARPLHALRPGACCRAKFERTTPPATCAQEWVSLSISVAALAIGGPKQAYDRIVFKDVSGARAGVWGFLL